ncbi:lipoamide acyltransferase component of branched-chain alpha-keto acid dehydrogenase complex, mitochondrial isoform X1 [Cephus cinctus]|uniref:Dihydrolipoamide acetyltransferase component of pyruvate dehydrogenase complex n=1 Tax=Cephus cinctus TaxID=211228 RepID=A0AAJ7C638_CEPCN|nr:lipoamide acyltransferase component of branched-chain alpha-keto acid dehydrogenase complex, mitochondrial isoform X1 [Cephus cinctus]
MAFILRPCTTILLKNVRNISINCIQCASVVPFKLSDIGEGIREVTVKEWFVKPGDRVAQFDEVCEVQSDKASVTITSRYDGVVKTLHYNVNESALVGDPLIDIEVDEDTGQVVSKEKDATEKTDQSHQGSVAAESTDSREELLGKVLATPAVRRIAVENKIKLKDVPATGKNGRVLKEDIVNHIQKDNTSTSAGLKVTVGSSKAVPAKRYTKHMWKTMTKSLSIPHFVYSDECDVSSLVRLRDDVRSVLKNQGVTLTYMPFFIKAVSRALEKIPELNAWLDEESESIKIIEQHNIALAMDTSDGLVVPNIKNVQDRSIVSIAKELNRLQELGSKASLPLNDLTGGTFSLSNIGVVGGTYTKPVILSPQVVIGAIGRIQKLPRFDANGNVVAANILSVSWAADHRVVDGVTMAKFSNIWKYYVENPFHMTLGV